MKDLIRSPFLRPISAIEQLWEESFFDEFSPTKNFLVDITDSGENINVRAELPGVKKDDIYVEFKDGILSLKAEKKEEIVDSSYENFIQKESYCGSMNRSFVVGDIDADTISATFTDGILKISMKKKDKDFKKISIQ